MELFASQLATNLKSQQHEVRLCALFPGAETLPFAGDVKVISTGKRNRLLDYAGWRNLAREIREFQPDLVQANSGDTLKYAVLSKMVFGGRHKILFRNASMVSLYLRSPVHKLFNRLLYRKVDHVVSVSQQTRKDLKDLFGLSDTKFSVIPNGVGQTNFSRLNWSREINIHLVHVGGFTFEKNHAGLLRIYKKLKRSLPGAILWLVGDGPLRPEIERQVRADHLTDLVHFTGSVKNPLDYIGSADALLLPSIIEGLPVVILEAFCTRTPVVAYLVGGVPEVLEDGVTGWGVPLGKEEEFAPKILECLHSKQKNEIMDRAIKRIRTEYDNKVIAQKFARLYNQLLNGTH